MDHTHVKCFFPLRFTPSCAVAFAAFQPPPCYARRSQPIKFGQPTPGHLAQFLLLVLNAYVPPLADPLVGGAGSDQFQMHLDSKTGAGLDFERA